MNWHLLTVLHALPTVAMAGVIWFVQVVHYPLYRLVGVEQFVAFERQHCRTISFVVMPMMLAELGLAGLVWWNAPPPAGAWSLVGLLLLAGIWACTFFVQVPCHDRLQQRFDRATIDRLVRTNWLRTIGWTLRVGVATALILA